MSAADDNHETDDFRPHGRLRKLLFGPKDGAYRLLVFAFVIGSASHLWLADAAQPGWMPANVTYLLGLVVLIVGGGRLGWLLCAIGLLIPLLFLRDQLTQSVFLLAVSAAGVWYATEDSTNDRGESLRAAVRWLTIATYAAAVFHKLNAQFLDPVYSCANYGMNEVYEYWNLDPAPFAALEPVHPFVALAFEVAIPLFYLVGRRHAARTIAVIFHIPLTMTMAPAFAFVMAAGHAAFVTDRERAVLADTFRRQASWLVPSALAITVASLLMHAAWPEPLMIPREFLLWFLLLWFLAAILPLRRAEPGRAHDAVKAPRFAVVLLLVYVLNLASPYTGLQYQHAAAMLSNLRIDEGCWNHVVVPESMRLTDDYVRVHEVWFHEPGDIEEYENIVLDQLWSPPQILQMRRNWCRPEIRPFHMEGTFRGQTWRIADLCDETEPWPFRDDGVLGVEVFSDYLRFQKNLERTCPQHCIH